MNLAITAKYSPIFYRNHIAHNRKSICGLQATLLKRSFIFLIIFLFHSTIQGQSLYDIKLEVKEIKSIKNLNERAVAWLIYAYKTTITNPQNIATKLTIDPTLLPNNYPYQSVINLLTAAEINKVQGEHSNSTKNVSKAIQILESKELRTNSEKKILTLAYVAFARFSKYSKNRDGINFGYKSLELATDINYPIAKVFAHNQIGLSIGYFKKDNTLALEHFEKAKKLLSFLPDNVYDFTSGFILGNIAKTWSELGDIEKSINYKLELLADKRNHSNLELMLGTNNNLGTNYYQLKKYDLAEKYLQNTLDLMDKHQLYTNRGIPLYRMALIQLNKEDLLKATVYTDAIDFWLISHQFIGGYLVSFYQLKSKIAKANLDFEQAIFWLEKASKEQESINQLASTNNLIKLEEENKLRVIQKERVLLEKELSVIKSQRTLLKVVVIITLLSSLLYLFIYKRNLDFKSINKQASSNDKIELITKTNSNKNLIDKKIDEELKQKINKALKEEKLFLSSDLTLKKFADHLNSNTSYVSKTINEGFGKNYNALINEYRIEEVVQLFQSGEHKTYTIESIYKKAGFKSKSSFQKAFKAKLGVTASYYIEQLQHTV